MNAQSFYVQHSAFTHAGKYAAMFNNLPTTVADLCKVVRGIYLHYQGGSLVDYIIPPSRLGEVDLRYVEAILDQVNQLDSRPLSEARSPGYRLVGCCRDSALLLCAMLRHQGIPARIRVGFADYFRAFPGFYTGHVITEYWQDARWKRADPEQSPKHIQYNRIDFDVTDIPPERFLTGGAAWTLCRRGGVNAELFGAAPDDFFKGWWALRNRVFHDLAMLNKIELLLWDTWGWLEYNFEPTEGELQTIDSIATLIQGDVEANFEEIRRIYCTDTRFSAPESVMCYSPTGQFTTAKIRF
jgi:hypothetical protein